MASCRGIRQALGVYVLGAIDPAERALVDEHLATCPDCREELASLAGLPAMLRKVPMVEAERLALGAGLGADELPSEEMLNSLVARTSNVRRIHRWRRLAAAAAVIVLALGGGAVAATALEHGPTAPHVRWQEAVGAGQAGVRLIVMYRHIPGATEIRAHVSGLKPGTLCEFQLVDSSGTSWPVGGWLEASGKAWVWYPASAPVPDRDVRIFQVAVNGKVVVSAKT